ncbi:hypothetical protein ONZ45_g4224 [Pleurotus djamor]|nr:hypothetical protein ONZ45_g4224 [Pleurotus djamor]
MSKSKQEEALQFLDDLDSFTPVEAPSGSEASPSASVTNIATSRSHDKPGGEAEVLAFLDEITQKSAEPTPRAPGISLTERPSSRAGTPSLRKAAERVRVGSSSPAIPGPPSSAIPVTPAVDSPKIPDSAPVQPAKGGWGWGSVWNTASAAIQQAKTVVDEQVKNLPNNEQARKWSEGMVEYAKTAQLDKLGKDFRQLGLSTLTDILNVVAPPISEHEVLQVWLSHDMRGYDGIETLVYRSLSRVMEQVEGGDLIVNRGNESRPKSSGEDARDLNAVDGYDAALKLAQANLDELIKANADKPTESKATATQAPVSYSHIYLRVQPFTSTLATLPPTNPDAGAASSTEAPSQLQFMLHLCDPGHQLVHTTVTQVIPGHWLDLWDQYDWVEDIVAEALRVGIEVVGQDYLVTRMGWAKGKQPQAGEAQSSEPATGATSES